MKNKFNPVLDFKSLINAGMDEGTDSSLNPNDARKLRKYRNSMAISAFGVILFGAWNIVKFILYCTLDTPVKEYIKDSAGGNEEAEIVVVVILFLIVSIDMIFRLIVAPSAIAEARGKKKGKGYVMIGILMVIVQATLLIYSICAINISVGVKRVIDEVVTMVVDATALYALIDTVYSSIRVKSIRKKAEGGK